MGLTWAQGNFTQRGGITGPIWIQVDIEIGPSGGGGGGGGGGGRRTYLFGAHDVKITVTFMGQLHEKIFPGSSIIAKVAATLVGKVLNRKRVRVELTGFSSLQNKKEIKVGAKWHK